MDDPTKNLVFTVTICLIFVILLVSLNYKKSFGAENNVDTSTEDELTRKELRAYDREAIEQQQELLDFYSQQKHLADENKILREKIEKQRLELEKKEEQIKMKESAPSPSPSPSQSPQQSTSKSLGQSAHQVAKETNRVVKKTDREVKRIFKKF